MAKTLKDLVHQVETRAKAQGPAAEAELAAFRLQFRLARLLSDRRQQLDLTQQMLGESAAIPQSEISKIENGRANPTIATVAALLHALELEIELKPTSRLAELGSGAVRTIPTFTRSNDEVVPFRNLHLRLVRAAAVPVEAEAA